jgi:hypothetical protein
VKATQSVLEKIDFGSVKLSKKQQEAGFQINFGFVS